MTTPIVPSVTDELIAELEAAADYAANQVIRSHGWEGTVDGFADGMLGADERYMRWAEPATILALLSERTELKRDAARMEWLAEQFKTCTVDMSGNHPYYPNSLKLRTLRGPTFRLAVDAAMTP